MKPVWEGLFPALWTPTDAAGALLTRELVEQVRFLRSAGANGVMALGSTGEFVHLEIPQRIEVLRLVAAECSPDWPLIANCSDVNPARVAVLGRSAREAGATEISLLPPWFFAMNAEDVVEFLVRGAEAAGLPLLIYNYPERTGHRLSLEIIAAVCDRVPVVALKQSGAEFNYHRELAELGRAKKYTLITGADVQIPAAFALGARGVVSGLSNAVPEWIAGAFRAVQAGHPERAEGPLRALPELVTTVAGLEFPLNMAPAMAARGRPVGAPKAILSRGTRSRYDRAVAEARSCLERHGLPPSPRAESLP